MCKKKILAMAALTVALTGASVAAQARDLVMSLIPAENNEALIKTFEPMRAYIEKKMGQKVRVFAATDYAGVVEAMKKKRVDIAWFGPLSYYLAEQEAGAEAFAVGMREGLASSSYHSYLTVPCDSGIRSIADLKGKRVAFVDPASTSGGLVPAYMVKQATGLMPRDFFGKISYAGSHDAGQLAVKNKTVDAAAVSSETFDNLLAKGLISRATNCVIAESAPLPGSPIVYRGDLPEATKKKLRDIILNAHKDIEVTGFSKLTHYVAASPKDYQVIRDLVKTMGLKKEALK